MKNMSPFSFKWTQPYHGWIPMNPPKEDLSDMKEAKQLIENIKIKMRNTDEN